MTQQDYQNLSALLSVAKFDNFTLQLSALYLQLYDKIQKLAQAPETDGNSNGTSSNKSSPEQPPEQQQ